MEFKDYLDGSEDAAALLLEVEGRADYERLLADARWLDDNAHLWCNTSEEAAQKDLFSLIRHVWDTAYTYGETETLRENV